MSVHDLATGLSAFQRSLASYDRLHLLASIGGLQLLPENADFALRLETLAHLTVSAPLVGASRKVSPRQLQRICQAPELVEPLSKLEDPCDNPVTEAITWSGGSHLVFPGVNEEAVFILQQLSRALFLHPSPFPSAPFVEEAVSSFNVALRLSHQVATKAGLRRGQMAHIQERGTIFVPQENQMRLLRNAVTTTRAEIRQWGLRGNGESILTSISLQAGEFRFQDEFLTDGFLHGRPVVRFGDALVIAVPSGLVSALRHRVILLAHTHDVVEALAYRYRSAIADTTRRALDRLHCSFVPLPLPKRSPDLGASEYIISCDIDKVLYVQVVADDLSKYTSERIFGDWDTGDLAARLVNRQETVIRYLLGNRSGLNDVAVIVVFQTIGRSARLEIGAPLTSYSPSSLIVSAADLETISMLRDNDQLLLWKWARAATRSRSRTKLFVGSSLDEFHYFRARGFSYHPPSDERLDAVAIHPGGAGELRREVARDADPHGVLWVGRRSYVDVRALYSAEIPLYASERNVDNRTAFLVGGLPLPVWVLGAEIPATAFPLFRAIDFHLVDIVSYWLWQLTPVVSTLLECFGREAGCIVVHIRLNPNDDWSSKRRASTSGASTAIASRDQVIRWELARDVPDVTLCVGAGIVQELDGPDNTGERQVMRAVLEALRALGQRLSLDTSLPDDGAIDRVLDLQAPVGAKKKVTLINSSTDPRLDSSGLAPYRKVQPADEEDLSDDLGSTVAQERRLSLGAVPAEQYKSVLNQAVTCLYKELERCIATLQPKDLLDKLILFQEAVTHERAEVQLTLPAREACFGEKKGFLENIRRELQDMARAGIAGRFLLEYVVARPPRGLRPLSLDFYDRLLAIAALIVDWGTISDQVSYLKVDPKLKILPSGRIGLDRNALLIGREGFMREYISGELHRAQTAFRKSWEKGVPVGTRDDKDLRDLSVAMKAEFGFTLEEFVDVIARLTEYGSERRTKTIRMPYEALINRLMLDLGVRRDAVERVINSMTLRPRADFMVPPAPFEKPEVYPWRFGRALSLNRRPLAVEDGDHEAHVVWGNRQIYASLEYIVRIIENGRLKAKSPAMLEYVGRQRDRAGKAFAEKVTATLRNVRGLGVWSRKRRFGKVAMSPGGQDLGDIDVLVVDVSARALLLIECKNMERARTPFELAGEIEKLFQNAPGSFSMVEKHMRRVRWVQAHLPEVVRHCGGRSSWGWRVDAIIVVDHELISPHLYSSPLSVVPFWRLLGEFVPAWRIGGSTRGARRFPLGRVGRNVVGLVGDLLSQLRG